jgi:hypothetical protein
LAERVRRCPEVVKTPIQARAGAAKNHDAAPPLHKWRAGKPGLQTPGPSTKVLRENPPGVMRVALQNTCVGTWLAAGLNGALLEMASLPGSTQKGRLGTPGSKFGGAYEGP